MKVRVLGSSGSEMPDRNLPAFLIDGVLMMDAGTISLSLNNAQQEKISHILLTHAHLDHIKGIPFLADNIIVTNRKHSVTIMSGRPVLSDLMKNVLNDRIWPDFTKLPTKDAPVLRLRVLEPGRPISINGYRVHCEPVTHAVPAFGYIVESAEGRAIAYTGDTGPTVRFWRKMARHNVCCLITEVSFPNSMKELAAKSGHLTASLLRTEIEKMPKVPDHIYITHAKPQYMTQIRREIRALQMKNITILRDGMVITV